MAEQRLQLFSTLRKDYGRPFESALNTTNRPREEIAQLAVPCRHSCRMDSDQYLMVQRSGHLYLGKLKNIRRPISCADNRFHTASSKML